MSSIYQQIKDFLKKHSRRIQWSIAVACIIYICHFFYNNRSDLETIRTINPSLLLAMTFFFASGHFIYAYRFNFVLQENSSCKVPFGDSLRLVILNRFFSVFAPQSGNIYQAVSLKEKYHIQLTHFLSSLVAINWFDTCLNFLLALVVVLCFRPDLTFAGISAVLLLILLFTVFIIIPIGIEFILCKISFKNPVFCWAHRRLSELFTVVLNNVKRPYYVCHLSLTGIVSFINATILLYLCFLAIGIEIDLPSVAFFHIVMKLCNRIMITPGNIGIREIAYGIIFDQINLGMGEGIAISIIMRIIGTAVICLLGLCFGGWSLVGTPPKQKM